MQNNFQYKIQLNLKLKKTKIINATFLSNICILKYKLFLS